MIDPRRILVALLCLSVGCAISLGSYSDLRYIEESGDLVGIQLTISKTGSNAYGTLKDFQGGIAEEIEVTGTVEGATVDLTGRFSGGLAHITGSISPKKFVGVLTYRLGETTRHIDLRLEAE